MEKPSMYVTGQNNTKLIRFIIAFLLSSITANMNLGFPSRRLNPSSDHMNLLQGLVVEGHFSFHDLHEAAKDFGNRYHSHPFAVLHPKSVSDIAKTVKLVYENGHTSKLTVAARGHAHSLQGQAQALDGLVINMESLKEHKMHVEQGEFPFVDVAGGELWINVLHETLKYGLAPKSWTDYLHLSVGGTLSNAGISGQAFKHGPQTSNVLQLEVVTGTGEVTNCSSNSNADLFQAALGGLGQFGIITRARIALEQAPNRVRWIRVLYSDFSSFVKDQEMLIAAEETFDYIEGFVIINRTGLLNNWRSSFNPQDPAQASRFSSDGRTLFCLEVVKYFNSGEEDTIEQEVDDLLAKLSYIPSTLFESEASYLEFLDRVHISEMKLRSQGLWEVPHPWLNLLVPRSKIQEFAENVFGRIIKDSTNGPILMYPLNKSRWDGKTSAVTPQEEIFYLVGFLSSAMPATSGSNSLEHILAQNGRVLEFCEQSRMGVKQYLPHYTTNEDWQAHFGDRWENLVRRKSAYDPLAILAPGQRIFKRINPSMEHDFTIVKTMLDLDTSNRRHVTAMNLNFFLERAASRQETNTSKLKK